MEERREGERRGDVKRRKKKRSTGEQAYIVGLRVKAPFVLLRKSLKLSARNKEMKTSNSNGG